jgi:RNA polymerase sigma-70 factor (ECF subfamily)
MDSPSQQAASTIDPALLARVVKGDVQAFSQLYDQSSTLLYTMALRMLGDKEDANELLQEVYLEVWRKVSRYDVGRGTPLAWLVTLNSRGQQKIVASLDGANQVPDRSPTPFDAQADQEIRMLVLGALTALPPAQQQALELAYYEGLSHAEIAAKLNQPLGTVKTRIKLGMSKLRESLRHCWDHGEHV